MSLEKHPWISVKERLPEIWETVLFLYEHKDMIREFNYRSIAISGYLSESKEFILELPLLTFQKGSGGIDFNYTHWSILENDPFNKVTHWMLLPNYPKKEA